MKRIVFASTFVCVVGIALIAQTSQLYPIPLDGKWGYIDHSGGVRIPARFEWASAFREGVAAVQIGGKYGFIDSGGLVVVQPTFDDALPFSEGLAVACAGEHCGFVDHSGKFVIFPQYGTNITYPGVKSFSEGVAAVFTKGKWGYIDKTGKLVIPPKYDFAESFSNQLAAVGVTGRPPSFGFIDHNGQVAIALQYHLVRSFHEGIAVVIGPELLGKWYGTSVIDGTGRCLYGPVADAINDYYEGLASAHSLPQGDLSFVDKQGKHVLTTRFAGENTIFSEGFAGVASANGKSGYINKAGELVINGQFSMTCPFTHGLGFVHTAQWAGYIDTMGQFVWKTRLASLGQAQIESCPDY